MSQILKSDYEKIKDRIHPFVEIKEVQRYGENSFSFTGYEYKGEFNSIFVREDFYGVKDIQCEFEVYYESKFTKEKILAYVKFIPIGFKILKLFGKIKKDLELQKNNLYFYRSPVDFLIFIFMSQYFIDKDLNIPKVSLREKIFARSTDSIYYTPEF